MVCDCGGGTVVCIGFCSQDDTWLTADAGHNYLRNYLRRSKAEVERDLCWRR